jgi:hypothetical protein
MTVQYIWFPTHGRMRRRIAKRAEEGLLFRGFLFSLNPLKLMPEGSQA